MAITINNKKIEVTREGATWAVRQSTGDKVDHDLRALDRDKALEFSLRFARKAVLELFATHNRACNPDGNFIELCEDCALFGKNCPEDITVQNSPVCENYKERIEK